MEVSLILRILSYYIGYHYYIPFLFSEDWFSHLVAFSFLEDWYSHPFIVFIIWIDSVSQTTCLYLSRLA